jgi:REP element-mobilizing transposase RayT
VIVKGHNGEPVVSSDRDRQMLLGLLAAALALTGVHAWAWALLTNHLHLFLRGPIGDVSRAMHRSLSPYAQGRNAGLGRSGSVFNGRFWSRPVHDDSYAVNLVAYVLLNPLKAGIVRTVSELTAYPWCSLGALVLDTPSAIPLQTPATLALFADEPTLAKERLLSHLERRAEDWRADSEMGSLPAIIRVIAARHGIPPETLCDGTRGTWFAEARRDAVIEAKVRGHTDTAIAIALGVTRGAVWKMALRAA